MSTLLSIDVITYNHAKFIRKCLDSILMQKTNFSFEVLIHDDASTDGTADIIREYEAKYPDIIKPIYQTENQWQKNIGISKNFQHPRIHGKYVALCEGDDYWTDENKLQKQVDFLEKHPEKIVWWWKNGDEHMQENFGIAKPDGSSFQPDFIVQYTDGRIGIYDTKSSGFQEDDTKIKSETLQQYISEESTKGNL